MVHSSTVGTIRLLHDEDIEEGQLVDRFEVLGEGNGGGKLVDVFMKLVKFFQPMWPTHIGVINIMFPPFGLEGKGVESHLFEILHIEVGYDWEEGGTPIHLLIDDILE